jgi:putative ABC transport system substrate-binding protein
VTVQSVRVSGSDEFDRAFAAIERGQPGGLIVLFGPLRGNDLPRIVDFVVQHRIPTVFEVFEVGQGVEAYIDKIANGAHPAVQPVEEPTVYELVINLRAARTMGITIPQSLLLRADRVIG